MERLMARHPEAREYDKLGRETDPKAASLLEVAMDYAVNKRNGSLEDGYNLAKSWADGLNVKAKQEAMGFVQAKKDTVTSGPSTSKGGESVVYVDNPEELLTRSLESQLAGQKGVRFALKPKT